MTIRFDHDRRGRIGLPECVFCESKTVLMLEPFLRKAIAGRAPVLLTRLSEAKFKGLSARVRAGLAYDAVSRTAFLGGTYPRVRGVSVAIVTAGTSDIPVAAEASRTLSFLGVKNDMICDVGVAGLWRLTDRLDEINAHDIVIVVAGMDAAIVSVLGGLTGRPLIAVPTSVGYGAADGGRTALFSALTSCAPGVLVTNIDNGYGAACAAFRILEGLRRGK